MKINMVNLTKQDKVDLPPFEFISAAPLLRQHDLKLFDQNITKLSLEQLADRTLEHSPDLVVLLGRDIKMYASLKNFSLLLRQRRDIPIVVCGGIKNSYRNLLERGVADIVVRGDVEFVLPEIAKNMKIEAILGLSFSGKGVIKENLGGEILDLDKLPFPYYKFIEMSYYLADFYKDEKFAHLIKNAKVIKRTKALEIFASRGCNESCTFCVNRQSGARRHSVDYVLDHVKFLQSEYGVGFIDFGDPCFTSDYNWTAEFINKIKRGGLDFNFRIYGARVDQVDQKLLRGLREVGCVSVYFGFESASQSVLDYFKKGTSVNQNLEIVSYARSIGLDAPVQLLIGIGAESEKTIEETKRALNIAGIGIKSDKVRFILPQPGTPIYEEYIQQGIIKNEEEYLMSLTSLDTTNLWCIEAKKNKQRMLQRVENE